MKTNYRINSITIRARIILIVLMMFSLTCNQSATQRAVLPTITPAAIFTPFPLPTSTLFEPTTTGVVVPTLVTQPTEQAFIALKATDTATPVDPAAPTPAAQAGQVEVDFINIGQGDSILIRSAEGKVALIDGGEQGSGALAYLSGKGITQIDLIVATHPHSDHIGGLVDVLGAIPVDRVVTNGQPHTTQVYERFLDGIANAEAEYIDVNRGDTIPLGSLSFQVLSPTTIAPNGDMNNNSLVLRLAVGQITFLFTGDAQAGAEGGMIGAGLPLKADILKVGHHGSHTASSPAFLAQVKPSITVYMAGAGNQYGQPHAETIAALTAIGAQIYGTDANGTIAITTDGSSYQVNAQGGPRAPPEVKAAGIPPAQTAPLSLEFTAVTSPVAHRALATLQAQTAPGAICAITVYYKSGPSKASGLGSKVADGAGVISWSWKVGANTTPGSWRIVVKCDQNGQSVTEETNFTVQ